MLALMQGRRSTVNRYAGSEAQRARSLAAASRHLAHCASSFAFFVAMVSSPHGAHDKQTGAAPRLHPRRTSNRRERTFLCQAGRPVNST
jgi:hypothetical protein